jgi:hypothetical protein
MRVEWQVAKRDATKGNGFPYPASAFFHARWTIRFKNDTAGRG